MLRDRILPQSEVIRAILLEDSPFCGVPHRELLRAVEPHAERVVPCHCQRCCEWAERPLSAGGQCFSRGRRRSGLAVLALASGTKNGRRRIVPVALNVWGQENHTRDKARDTESKCAVLSTQ